MAEYKYNPPFGFSNGHIQTLYPPLFRTVDSVKYQRERIETFDSDFLDLDWSRQSNNKLVIISHGLEGNTSRAYVQGMVQAVNNAGWDALAWNYRSCSGEPNRKLRSYHNGITDDLSWVIQHAKKNQTYTQIALIGFSLGGNLTLLYLGREIVDPIISKAIVFSVPCDLKGSAAVLKRTSNKLYMKRFLILLHKKIRSKMKLMPELIDDKQYNTIKDFKAFDDRYTAPIHGFKDAYDYWKRCSSRLYIPYIKTPTLIVNAVNDPFLSESCYPFKEVHSNKQVTLETPQSGGHVGFISFNHDKVYWSEKRAVQALISLC